MQNDYKGFSLFNDIEDAELQLRNRAVVMCNIVDMNTRGNKITPKGAGLVLGYFNSLPDSDKKKTEQRFEQMIKERGYARSTH